MQDKLENIYQLLRSELSPAELNFVQLNSIRIRSIQNSAQISHNFFLIQTPLNLSLQTPRSGSIV